MISRYLAREMGLSGKSSLDNAMVDEIVDVVQDILDKNVSGYYHIFHFRFTLPFQFKAWYAPNKKEALKEFTEKIFPVAMAQLEKKLSERGQRRTVLCRKKPHFRRPARVLPAGRGGVHVPHRGQAVPQPVGAGGQDRWLPQH